MDLAEKPEGDFVRHPWETARCSFFQKMIVRHRLNQKVDSVLDIGSGDAWFALQTRPLWEPKTNFVCWDLHYHSSDLIPRSQITFIKDPPKDRFDLILLLDVLEHIQNDENFLKDLIQKNLKSGGRIFISVPAWPLLFSKHDLRLQHFRRYRPSHCRDLMIQAGLKIVASGGLFHSLVFPRLLTKLFVDPFQTNGSIKPDPLSWQGGKIGYSFTKYFLGADNWISTTGSRLGIQVPGLSFWAIAYRMS